MKYMIEIYGGRTYCGNAYCKSIDECIAFANEQGADEGLITRAVIMNLTTQQKMTVRFWEVNVTQVHRT